MSEPAGNGFEGFEAVCPFHQRLGTMKIFIEHDVVKRVRRDLRERGQHQLVFPVSFGGQMTSPDDRYSDETAFIEMWNRKGGLKRLHNGTNCQFRIAVGAIWRIVPLCNDSTGLIQVLR